MGITESAYDSAASAYEDTLARLSRDFWAGMKAPDNVPDDNDPDISDDTVAPSPHKRLAFISNTTGTSIKDGLINGVVLSRTAIDQLRTLGLPLEWYTAGELEDIQMACSVDATLIDDEFGDNLHDKLYLDSDEKEERRNNKHALHGFHPDELEHCGVTRRKRVKRSQPDEKSSLIPDCEKESIFAGLRMLLNPCHVSNDDHIESGLHKQNKQQQESYILAA